MIKSSRFIALALCLTVAASTTVYACHSNYFNEMFVKLKNMRDAGDLEKDQIASIWQMHSNFMKIQHQYNREGKPSSALDPHVKDFVAAAAGVLDADQFKQVTGKKKTEVQELRYEVAQLRKEIREVKALLEEIKAQTATK